MKRGILSCTVVLAVCGAAGCLSFPRSPEGTSVPSYVGDRNTVALGTVIAPVAVASDASYQNLNASLAALINTRKLALLSDTRDVREIVRGNQPRIFARVVKAVSGSQIAACSDIERLRAEIEAQAQAQFDAVFKQWSDAPKYDVRIVVTALYLTTADAGLAQPRRWW